MMMSEFAKEQGLALLVLLVLLGAVCLTAVFVCSRGGDADAPAEPCRAVRVQHWPGGDHYLWVQRRGFDWCRLTHGVLECGNERREAAFAGTYRVTWGHCRGDRGGVR